MNGHHSSMNRHHRSCDCLFDDLDNPVVECTFLDVDTINNIYVTAPTTTFRNSQFTRLIMPSAANAHGIFMCAVIDVMHTIQHGIIMYCLESFKKGIAMNHWRSLMEWHFPLTRPVVKLYDLVSHGLTSHVESQTSPRSNALNSLALSSCLRPLQCKLKDGISLRDTSQIWTLFWQQLNDCCVSRLGWISSHFGMSTIQLVRRTRLKLQLLLFCALS
jgi:hypothetical protein